MMGKLRIFPAMFFTLFIPLGAITGQEAQRPHSVIVAIAESLPMEDASAVVVRYSDSTKEDIVLLRQSDTSPLLLASALNKLQRWRVATETVKGTQQIMAITRVKTYDARLPALNQRYRSLISRIEKQPTVQIGNTGTGRWLRLSNLSVSP